ncbi:MAG: DegT/DnrJ/EryC1/StrS family aminotransferase [Candidatus Lokiarchaeota archaeon]|nr:DegT/DnrJ/EryC1/StrS family aminotransferase [Candidatus Lokiarchaeota archaeon]
MKKACKYLKQETIDDLKRAFLKSSEREKSGYDFPLVRPPFNIDEILEALDSLISTRVTMGEKVKEFEKRFADYVGTKHAIMFNSGSSANLIALEILANPVVERGIEKGGSVIVPALTWSTSVFPIVDIGAKPVFADSLLKTLNLDPSSVEKCIDKETDAILAVHLIGNPCDMKALNDLAEENNLLLVEDCCEAHGAEFDNKRVGSLSEMGTYSFFFSHHISTIEGGMITTDNDEFAELARILRAHGWTRDMKNRDSLEKRYPDRDPRFLFVNRGYNLRPTEIQGAFGIHQIAKLDSYVRLRRRNASILADILEDSNADITLQKEQTSGKHSWFGFPFVLNKGGWDLRKRVITRLEKRGIETRVVMGGNMAAQPATEMYDSRSPVPLNIAEKVDRSGVLVGIHPQMSEKECKELGNRIIAALAKC